MPQRAEEVHAPSLGTDRRDRLLGPPDPVRPPQVASRDDPRRAVADRVRVQRDHDGGPERRPRPWPLDVPVVVVQRLRPPARVDHDGVEGRELVSRVEEVVVEREHARQDREPVEDVCLVEERVDSIRAVAFEGVAAGQGFGPAEAVDLGSRVRGFGGREEIGEDHVAVGEDVVDVGAESGVCGEGLGGAEFGVD